MLAIARWVLLLPLVLLVRLSSLILAPVAVVFFSSQDRKHLKPPFRWLETIDNDLAGDGGWQSEHLVGDDPLTWTNRIRWLWRNGANAVMYGPFGVPAWAAWPRAFEWRRFIPIGHRFIELWCGWALAGPQLGRCKYAFAVRIRTSAK